MTNVTLSRRVAGVINKPPFANLTMLERFTFARLVDSAADFDSLPEAWQTRVLAAEQGDTKGGPGSGNWGHEGRPGERGGSAPSPGGGIVGVRGRVGILRGMRSTDAARTSILTWPRSHSAAKKLALVVVKRMEEDMQRGLPGEDRFARITANRPEQALVLEGDNGQVLGIVDATLITGTRDPITGQHEVHWMDGLEVNYLASSGAKRGTGTELMAHMAARARDYGVKVWTAPTAAAVPFYEKLGMHMEAEAGGQYPRMEWTVEEAGAFADEYFAEKKALSLEDLYDLEPEDGVFTEGPPNNEEKGGPGSGNWGHEGRPGEQGGSAPNDGGGGEGGAAPHIDRIRAGTATPEDIQAALVGMPEFEARLSDADKKIKAAYRAFDRALRKKDPNYTRERADAAEAVVDALEAERKVILGEYGVAKAAFAELLGAPDPIDPPLTAAVSKASFMRQDAQKVRDSTVTVNKGFQELSSLLDKSVWTSQPPVTFIDREFRAWSNGKGMALPIGDPESIAQHEFGHIVEYNNPRIHAAARSFVDERIRGQEPVPLRTLGRGYNSDELAVPDKFISPYIGKVYDDGQTEVVSMGLTCYAQDPADFAQKDPEHFQLIYRIAHGDFTHK